MRPLLQLHSYAHSYLPILSLHGQRYEVCTGPVRTIGGSTLHHVAMAHYPPPRVQQTLSPTNTSCSDRIFLKPTQFGTKLGTGLQ